MERYVGELKAYTTASRAFAAMTTSAMRGEATKKLTARHMAAERTSVTMRIFFRLPLSAFAPPIRLNTICTTVSELLVKRQHPRRVSESADNAHAVRVIKNDVAELGRPLSKPEQRLVLSLFSHISPQPSSTQPSFSSE